MTDKALAHLDTVFTLAGRASRADLQARLVRSRARLESPTARVIVVGEFKQGKSLLVNALVNAQVCPVDADVATSVPTVVSYGPAASASLVFVPRGTRDTETESVRVDVPIAEIASRVSEQQNPDNEKRLLHAEVELPRPVLSGGLVLVDTPGVGGMGSAHSARTLAALATADAMLLVSDASQEYSEPEIAFLKQAIELCPNVACVLTKVDVYPQWRRIREIDEGHLATAGIEAAVLPTSAMLRLHALSTNDAELHQESGFGELAGYLRDGVLGNAENLARRSASNDLVFVVDNLTAPLRAELESLQDPVHREARLVEMEDAKVKADELRKRSARWQVTLADGVADLMADIDHDLRDRVRKIQREAEEAIDLADPGLVWPDFVEWLERSVAGAISDNFVWAHGRAEWLSAQVAEHFDEYGRDMLPELLVTDTASSLDPVAEVETIERVHMTGAQKVLTGMRGSYGGVLMFGLLTSVLTGMPVVNPLSLGAGVVLGVKSYAEEKRLRLKRRQGEAKMLVRRYIDDVTFQVGKQSKEHLRVSQRIMRDHFSDVAEQMHLSINRSLQAAQQAAKIDGPKLDKRIKDVTGAVARLDELRAESVALSQPRHRAVPAQRVGAGA